MIKGFWFLALTFATLAVAEDSGTAEARKPQGTDINLNLKTQPGTPYNGRDNFDSKVFDAVGKEPIEPEYSKSEFSGKVRARTRRDNVMNSADRERLLAKCMKLEDLRQRGDCFNEGREEIRRKTDENIDAVGNRSRSVQGINETPVNPESPTE